MADLRALFERAGYDDVRTLLQSGNVVLASAEPAEDVACDLERRIADGLGMDVDVIVRTAEELEEIVSGAPLADVATDPRRHFVVFLPEPPDDGTLAELGSQDFSPDRFAAGRREVFAWCPEGMQGSRLMKELGRRRLARTYTVRNFSTVTKLLDMVR
jgi:uncharacterized protein (DUF1697 family)